MQIIDTLIEQFDKFIRTVSNTDISISIDNQPHGISSSQQKSNTNTSLEPLSDSEKKHSAGLMRVNHVGEICAQALYRGQQVGARNSTVLSFLQKAEQEEQQHLNWCYTRIIQLNSHTSYLNPLWYIGAFGIGLVASKISDTTSLTFVVETEKQVERHLEHHLDLLPKNDICSRSIIKSMIVDERQHADHAQLLGGSAMPTTISFAMKQMAKVMTSIAYYI